MKILTLLFLLVSCATLTTEEKEVQIVKSIPWAHCQKKADIEVKHVFLNSLLVEVRKRAVENGGNYVKVLRESKNFPSSYIVGEVYSCLSQMDNGEAGEDALMKACNEAGNALACLDLAHAYWAKQEIEDFFFYAKKSCEFKNPLGCDYYGLSEKWKEAEELRNKLLSSCDYDDNAVSCQQLGKAYRQMKDIKKAVVYFQKACKLGTISACNDEKSLLQEEKIKERIKTSSPSWREPDVTTIKEKLDAVIRIWLTL